MRKEKEGRQKVMPRTGGEEQIRWGKDVRGRKEGVKWYQTEENEGKE